MVRDKKSIEANLVHIRQKLNELVESKHHMPYSIPLAPPPPVPPVSSSGITFGDDLEQNEKQKPKNRTLYSKSPRNTKENLKVGDLKKSDRTKYSGHKRSKSDKITENELVSNSSFKLTEDNQTGSIADTLAPGEIQLKERVASETDSFFDKSKPRTTKHIHYFSSDLTLTDEERLKLVCEDWDKNEFYGKVDSKQSTYQQPTHQQRNQIPWNSPMPSSRNLLPSSLNLTTSASQAASAAVRLLRRDFFDRLTNRGPNRGVYRLDTNSHRSPLDNTTKQESCRLLDQTNVSDMNFNEYESFDQSEQMDTTSSDERNFFARRHRRAENVNDDEESDSFSENNTHLNDEYYEEIDENYYNHNKNVVYAKDAKSSASQLKSSGHQWSESGRHEPKLSKIKTVLTHYESANYMDMGQMQMSNQEDPNDSLNNLDFSIDTENLAHLKCEPRVLRKSSEFEYDQVKQSSDEIKAMKAENTSNRTYEEIMQINSLDYTDIDLARANKHKLKTEYSRSYRVSNPSGSNVKNIGRRNRSGSNKSSWHSVNGTSAGRRFVSTGAVVTIDSASLFNNEEGTPNNVANRGTASIYGIRLGKFKIKSYSTRH